VGVGPPSLACVGKPDFLAPTMLVLDWSERSRASTGSPPSPQVKVGVFFGVLVRKVSPPSVEAAYPADYFGRIAFGVEIALFFLRLPLGQVHLRIAM